MGTYNSINKENFATLENVEELGKELEAKVNEYYENLSTSKRIDVWRKVYRTKYAGYYTKGGVLRKGRLQEKRKARVNHFKNILQHLVVMTINQRPAWDARAVNSDHKTYSQVILAKGLLDYYMRTKRLEKFINQAVERAIDYGEGYVLMEWDETEGDIYGEQEKSVEQEAEELIKEENKNEDNEDEETKETEVVKTGDVVFTAYAPIDIVRDYTNKKLTDCTWFIIRRFVNKFDYAAKYPDFTDDITDVWEDRNINKTIVIEENIKRDYSSDIIPVYTFYHKKTSAVPKGKMVEFINADIVTFNGDLPYEEVPLYSITPELMDEQPFGYSPSYELLELQDIVTMIHSSVVTNQNAFGVQNITVPKGSGIEVSAISDGLNLIEYHENKKPEPLQVLSTPPEMFEYMKYMEHTMETLSGVNSVARGNPEASLKSGAALALVQSMAIQFSSMLQSSYTTLLEDLGTGLIRLLKEFATVPRVANIAGQSNRSYLKEFKGDDLSEIDRVIVDVGNPLSKTTAGKVDMANQLLQTGLIKTAEQYVQVLDTGKVEPLTENLSRELMLIKAENEDLNEGKEVVTTIIDNHILHIEEHKAVLSSPEARQSEIVQITTNHIQQHIEALQTADPFLLSVLGQPIPPQMGMPPGGQPPNNEGQLNADKTPQPQPNQPNMPNMPKNAMTGETWNQTTGGL
jgi:hypothetical protein